MVEDDVAPPPVEETADGVPAEAMSGVLPLPAIKSTLTSRILARLRNIVRPRRGPTESSDCATGAGVLPVPSRRQAKAQARSGSA